MNVVTGQVVGGDRTYAEVAERYYRFFHQFSYIGKHFLDHSLFHDILGHHRTGEDWNGEKEEHPCETRGNFFEKSLCRHPDSNTIDDCAPNKQYKGRNPISEPYY